MRHDDISVLTIRRVANGYIVETGDPAHGRMSITVFVFQSLSAMNDWLKENFGV